MYRLYDLKCQSCSHESEELLNSNDLSREEELRYYNCSNCGNTNTSQVIFKGCRVNTMGCLTKEDYSKKMAKRSEEHSKWLKKHERFS
jgi:uncharacterized Zn finger protein